MEEPCKILMWDSAFFGYKIAQVEGETLTPARIMELLEWSEKNRIECLYFLANLQDHNSVRLAEQNKFNFTDVRVTLKARLTPGITQAGKFKENVFQVADTNDIFALKEIARVNHRDSRFYYDGNFPREKCDELFSTWIENSCHGFADIVLIKKGEVEVEGYITCSIDKRGIGNIGLLGVNPNYQGLGVGHELIQSALKWFESKNIAELEVVTQGRNFGAQRIYQRNGFLTESVKSWYHRWLIV